MLRTDFILFDSSYSVKNALASSVQWLISRSEMSKSASLDWIYKAVILILSLSYKKADL